MKGWDLDMDVEKEQQMREFIKYIQMHRTLRKMKYHGLRNLIKRFRQSFSPFVFEF